MLKWLSEEVVTACSAGHFNRLKSYIKDGSLMKNKKFVVLLLLFLSLCLLVAGGRAKSVSDATLDETSTPAGTTRPPEDQSGPEGGEGAQESVRDADDENVSQSEEGPATRCLEESCGGCDRLTHCKPCFGFEMERDSECLVTGYKHRVLCLKSSEKKFVACDPKAEDTSQETLKFWVFQFMAAVGLIVGRSVARLRQRVHEKKALKKMQKHIEA